MTAGLFEIIKIADIHAARIQMALNDLKEILPFDQNKISTIEKQNLLLIELLVSRFGQLQDLLGTKLIDIFLQEQAENIDGLSMLDKIHKLERLEIIEDAEIWKEMRQARNHAVHEYPDHPELTADYLNQLVALTPQLLEILNRIKVRSAPLEE